MQRRPRPLRGVFHDIPCAAACVGPGDGQHRRRACQLLRRDSSGGRNSAGLSSPHAVTPVPSSSLLPKAATLPFPRCSISSVGAPRGWTGLPGPATRWDARHWPPSACGPVLAVLCRALGLAGTAGWAANLAAGHQPHRDGWLHVVSWRANQATILRQSVFPHHAQRRRSVQSRQHLHPVLNIHVDLI